MALEYDPDMNPEDDIPSPSEPFMKVHNTCEKALYLHTRNSVGGQVLLLMWDAAVANATHQALLSSPFPSRDGGPGSDIADAVMRWYVNSQLVALRRLIDAGDYKKKDRPTEPFRIESERGVYSLRSILGYIRQHRELFTRANLAGTFRYFMRPDVCWQAYLKSITTDTARRVDLPSSPETSEEFHRSFDRIARVDAEHRKADDIVSDAYFKWLDDRLNRIEKRIKWVVDKRIAHAASTTSHAENRRGVFWSEIDICQREACRVYWSLCVHFIDSSNRSQFIAEPAYPIAYGMDNASLGSSFAMSFEQAWNQYQDRVRQWSEFDSRFA